ncbi:hypothetical protein [Parasedimentitalea huanghaiensis]|uniref:Uncharacterized protein n=1 Tax=Parasedimentitalea huanghaiensis TaxID=2682100 RepID=A0A6L6WES3_9RHOB|nr:hypothetical protein [Zongyanglinia huanghaiensis]MVO16214.1 hypothetical protein [Zongyanglinia huanghaiensis]
MKNFLSYLILGSVSVTGAYAQDQVGEMPSFNLEMFGAVDDVGAGLRALSVSKHSERVIEWQIIKSGDFEVDYDSGFDEVLQRGLEPVICENCDAWELPSKPVVRLNDAGHAELAGVEFCPDCTEVDPLPECESQLKDMGYSGYRMQASPRYVADFLDNGPVDFNAEKIVIMGELSDTNLMGMLESEIAEYAGIVAAELCPNCTDVDPLPTGCDNDEG